MDAVRQGMRSGAVTAVGAQCFMPTVDAAGQLAADIRKHSPGAGRPVSVRLAVFKDDIASAQAITCGPGIPTVGDSALWDGLNAAMDRAGPAAGSRTWFLSARELARRRDSSARPVTG